MIHIFFTHAVIDNQPNFIEKFQNTLKIGSEEDIFVENVIQFYYNNENRFTREITLKTTLESQKDSLILIHDKCTVNNENVLLTDSEQDFIYFSKTQFKEFLKNSDTTECTVYFHENGLKRHKAFIEWIEEVKEVNFYFKDQRNSGTLKAFSHLNASPFHKLLNILESENSEEFKEKLLVLKNESFGSDEEIDDNKILNKKLTLLHKLLGGQELEKDSEEDRMAEKALKNYAAHIIVDSTKGLSSLRDKLLKDYV